MNTTTRQLLDQARLLSDEERNELVDALLKTLNGKDSDEFRADFEAEMEIRLGEMRSGEVAEVPWESVRDLLDRS